MCCILDFHTKQAGRRATLGTPSMSSTTRRRVNGSAVDENKDDSKPTSKEGFLQVKINPASGHLGVTLSTHAGSVRVQHCHPADLIAKAGLSAGDIVNSINGSAISDHAEALNLMCNPAKKPFTVEFSICPEKAAVRSAGLSAQSASRFALALTVPSLVTLGSADLPTACAPVIALLAAAAAVRQAGRNAPQSLRALAFLSVFVSGFLFVSACQEVRRCVTDLCDSPTMYGTAADCRRPCGTSYGINFHWPACGASLLASVAAGFSCYRAHCFVESVEEKLQPLGVTEW